MQRLLAEHEAGVEPLHPAITLTSRIVADELRKAERSINLAARDTAKFLVTTLEATEAHSHSPAMTQRTVKATVAELAALVDGRDQMAMLAHLFIEKVGLQLGIEDAQSVMEWFGTPTWALGGVERLAFVAIPERVRRVIVYGDRGRAAERLFTKARDHLSANGREVVCRVPDGHEDWNDAWRAFKCGAGGATSVPRLRSSPQQLEDLAAVGR